MNQRKHSLSILQAELWAITPDALQQIIAIAQGYGDAEAVAARLGKPLTNAHTASVRDGVAVIPVIGPIFRYANLFTEISGATSVQILALDLQTAIEDPNVKAIILEIDSPGGMVAGISEFAAQVRAANSIKSVVAYISDMGASAAYWIAAAAGEIISSDTARSGSIGVVMQATIDTEQDTIKFISSQSPLKHADPGTDAGKMQYQKNVDALAEVFITSVAGYRGATRAEVIANFGLGSVLIASEALSAGMIDRIGSLEAVIAGYSVPTKPLLIGGKPHSSTYPGIKLMDKPTITRESLAADYPDIYKALTDEAYAAGLMAGKAQGAESERLRIQGIEELATLGHDALIAQFKFDGQTTAAEAALKILGAEKTNRAAMADKLKADTPLPVPHAVASLNDGGQNEDGKLTGIEKWEHDYKNSADLKAEFPTMGAYVAYQKAAEKGLVRRLGAAA